MPSCSPRSRVQYHDQPMVYADGRDINADKAWEAARRLEAAAAATAATAATATTATSGGGGGGEGGKEGGGENELEAALEAVLDAEMEGQDEDEDEDEEEEEEEACNQEVKPSSPALPSSLPPSSSFFSSSTTTSTASGDPPANFSRVDLTALGGVDYALYPSFPRHLPLKVEVSEGDMFYVPAGWFHEVRSKGGVHAAFNYWVHPPDALGKEGGFKRPYVSDFWERDWRERGREGGI